jgi:hypothetical protein
MHKCKCIYCKIEFDRDKLPYVQISERRYAHKDCADKNKIEKTKNELDYEALINYIEKLFGIGYVSAKVAKQIKDFKEQYGYTYSGILGTLVYWYEVKGATLEMANGGIGIVPYVYEQAKEYYAKINEANNINMDVVGYKFKVKEIIIESPQQEMRQPRLFRLEEETE